MLAVLSDMIAVKLVSFSGKISYLCIGDFFLSSGFTIDYIQIDILVSCILYYIHISYAYSKYFLPWDFVVEVVSSL